jgi:hypothetical protein
MSWRVGVAAAVLLVGSSLAASSARSPPVAPFAIHDFTPEFWRFWEAAQNQPVEQQEKLWQQLYVAPHKAVFDDLAGPCKAEYDPAWARAHYFPGLPGVVPQIRAMVAGLAQQLDDANGRFLKTFADMRWFQRTRADDPRSKCVALRSGCCRRVRPERPNPCHAT